MSVLEKIIEYKKEEIKHLKELYPVKLLETGRSFHVPVVSLVKYLKRPDKKGIIAEIKRKSPSKGVLNTNVNVELISIGYMKAGASALSVLTDRHFFGGSNKDLMTAREFNFCPILRKDFIIDEYQIVEARSIGADAILLIAAALTPAQLKVLAAFAKSLGLEVVLEVHSEEEYEQSICDDVDIVGVNNRNLGDFTINVETSHALADKIHSRFTKISESGIKNHTTINELKAVGYQGFLIGEHFMITPDPAKECEKLVRQL